MENCIFCKIVKGEIPSNKVYEDEKTIAFLDINPVSKCHLLVIPKNHCIDILDMNEEDAKAVIVAAKKVANAVSGVQLGTISKGIAGGYRKLKREWAASSSCYKKTSSSI